MHKIDGPGHVGGQFVSEDPATGRAPTMVTADWLNAVQNELVAVVEASGAALNKANSAQVLAALKVIFGDGPGAVSFYARSTAPIGYLKANGATVSRTAYAELFASIGTLFGAGDGSTTFLLPDLRGQFLRSFDDGRGVDAGRVLGTAQNASRVVGDWFGLTQAGAGSRWWGDFDGTNDLDSQGSATLTSGSWGQLFDGGKVGTGIIRVSGFTRPTNVALLACIKY